MAYLIIGIILVGALVFYWTSLGDKSTVRGKQTITQQDTTKPGVHQTKENVFEGLRSMAFSATPERLGLLLSPKGQLFTE